MTLPSRSALLISFLLFAGASFAADLRFATLHPTGNAGEWRAVVEGKATRKKDAVVVWIDGEPVSAEWQASGKRLEATLDVPPRK